MMMDSVGPCGGQQQAVPGQQPMPQQRRLDPASLDGVVNELTWRCGDFKTRFVSALDGLWEAGDFVDVTLACEGQCLKAHRLVLSMGSEYFKSILRDCDARGQHPVVFFRDISFADLKSVVDFLYTGMVTVRESHFESFLKTAESLRVEGLTFEEPKSSACKLPEMLGGTPPKCSSTPVSSSSSSAVTGVAAPSMVSQASAPQPAEQQEDEPLSLCVDNRSEDAKRSYSRVNTAPQQLSEHEIMEEDTEEEEEEISEPLCMTYEPPDKKAKSSNGGPMASTAAAGAGTEMAAFAAGGLMDFQQLDGIYDKMSSFCAESLLKQSAGALAGAAAGPADFAFDTSSQGFARFAATTHSGSGGGVLTVKEAEIPTLEEDQAWDLNYRTSTVTNCESVTDLSNGGSGQQHVGPHGCVGSGDDEGDLGVEPLSLHQNPPQPVAASASSAILPVISLNLSDGGGFVESPPPQEMNLTVKREEASNGHADVDPDLNHDLQSSSSSGSVGGSGSSNGKGKEVICGQCGKAYVNIRSLQMHRKVHTGETTCPICNKVMNRTSDIKRHIQMVHYGKCAGGGGSGGSGGGSGAGSPLDNRLKY